VIQIHRDLGSPLQVHPPEANARIGFAWEEGDGGRSSGMDPDPLQGDLVLDGVLVTVAHPRLREISGTTLLR
jgi:hypothetical protein